MQCFRPATQFLCLAMSFKVGPPLDMHYIPICLQYNCLIYIAYHSDLEMKLMSRALAFIHPINQIGIKSVFDVYKAPYERPWFVIFLIILFVVFNKSVFFTDYYGALLKRNVSNSYQFRHSCIQGRPPNLNVMFSTSKCN